MQKEKNVRKGSVILLMMISLGAIIMLAAFCINVAYMQLVRTELRAASDAAARAGAEALSREDSESAAVNAVIQSGTRNRVGGGTLNISRSDIELGRTTVNSSGQWVFTKDATPFSAVRVNARTQTTLMMGGVTSREFFSPQLTSTASFNVNEICLVVDRSHSMCFDETGADWVYPSSIPRGPQDPVVFPPADTGSRWAALEQSIVTFLSAIRTTNSTQKVALVTWGSEITLSNYEGRLTGRTFPAASLDVPMGTNTTAISNSIFGRGAQPMLGGTNCSAGMEMGIAELTGSRSTRHASKTMILMTDGKWNQGRNPVLTAEDAKNRGIVVHTVTFLQRADQTDMQRVAAVTGGKHYHASNAAQLDEAFRELARSLPVALTD